jgi:eukaryotic-like serine/threonine-protein kinase
MPRTLDHRPGPSSLVLGRYRLGPMLGRGGTAWVYRAEDVVRGGLVAVKAIPAEPERAARVGAEIRAAARLDHPGIVALLDWGEDGDWIYLVWELVDGRPLSEALRSGGLADRVMASVAGQVLEALAHAHERGVVHRDVKPSNILLGRDGRARLSDFGVARLSGESGLTRAGGVVGTLAYMAPEQAAGERAGAPADVYAACLTLYEGLTGANPIVGAGPAETARRAAAADVPALARVRPDLPAALVRAVDAGLRRDPARRPDAAALARAVGASGPGASRAARLAPALASAAGGAAVCALLLARGTDAAAVAIVAGAAGASVAFAVAPLAATLCAVVAAALLLGASAPVAAALIAALTLLALLPMRRSPRLMLLPAAAPALFALGLGPLYAVAAGLVAPWPRRLWAAAAGAVAALGWAVVAGSERPLLGGEPLSPAARALEGTGSPATVVRRLAAPLREQPGALTAVALLAAAAMAVPLLLRTPPGARRLAAVVAWAGGLAALQIALAGDATGVIEAIGPSAILLAAWAARPWRPLARRPESRPVATLRGPAA